MEFEKNIVTASQLANDFCNMLAIACNSAVSSNQFSIWYPRLGHMSCNKMKSVLNFNLMHNGTKDFICEICLKAREHRLPFAHSTTIVASEFELIHVYTWGPYHTNTHSGHRYFLTILDDHSRATRTHHIVTKDEAVSLLKTFVTMAKS